MAIAIDRDEPRPGTRGPSAGDRPAARSLLAIFARSVADFGERVAVEASGETLSYRELELEARALAERLERYGVGPGDRVGVRVRSGSAELYVAILGVLRSGAAYVPVDADDPEERAATVWRAADACAVVGDELAIDVLAPGRGSGRDGSLDDDAWVIFTSGSTGEPKGVAVSHRSAAAFVDAEARLWRVDPEDRILAGLSVAFDASCEEIWTAWRHGAALVPAPRTVVRSGEDFGPWLLERKITVVSTVPTLAAMWTGDVLANVRLLILGGEACPPELGWRLAASCDVWNTYGPTEATVVSTATRIVPGQPITIGRPLDGWQVVVTDEAGHRVGEGEAGELVIGGVGLGRYLDPALDAERFAGHPQLDGARAYRTGDVVRATPLGLEFLGRRDDQVKIGGRRIELGELDAQMAAVPGVRVAAAVVRETDAGNRVLVGYVAGTASPEDVRSALLRQLPAGIVPLIVPLEALPTKTSGKVDRHALPWPPPGPPAGEEGPLGGTTGWLAERWAEQLGPLPMTADSDFFALGGSSLAAAKLVSVLRERFPTVAVSDVYGHRRLGALAERLDQLGEAEREPEYVPVPRRRRWGVVQSLGLLVLLCVAAGPWLVGILAYNDIAGAGLAPRVSWLWLAAGWIVFASAPGRATIVLAARWLLLGRLKPGRYPRHGWLACRIWFVERLAETCRLEMLAGTPWAGRYARISGTDVGSDARLGTLPPPTALVEIGSGATLEPDVDAHGWVIEGDELVVGPMQIGRDARIGTRTVLMPGAVVGDGAEIEPGSVVTGRVPAGERWAGSPARYAGPAGVDWPSAPAPLPTRRRLWRAMFGVGLAVQSLVPLLAAAPGLVLIDRLGSGGSSLQSTITDAIYAAPLVAGSFLLAYALLIALLVRTTSKLIRPGWHADEGATGWALWFNANLMASARTVLFPLFSSIYTRSWLALCGIRVGRRAEISTAVGLNHLVDFDATSFAADDVVFAGGRARGGWLQVSPITVGRGSFLGNGSLLPGETALGDDSLVGVLTVAPRQSADGTSWFGAPALEFPRVPTPTDPARTTDPPRRLVVARGAMELLRILLPSTISVVLAAVVFLVLDAIGQHAGLLAMIAATPLALLVAGLSATAITIAAKWLIMGRYRAGEHPLWSFFVWRDELLNSFQEQLAGAWLLDAALATPVMSLYLRAMGSTVGHDVWCETLTITEFDLVELGNGCAVNRRACVETHLFHDRLMRIGPTAIGAGATIGPSSAVLPDTTVGAGCVLGARSVVLRGERLPAGTRWHGAPVVGVTRLVGATR